MNYPRVRDPFTDGHPDTVEPARAWDAMRWASTDGDFERARAVLSQITLCCPTNRGFGNEMGEQVMVLYANRAHLLKHGISNIEQVRNYLVARFLTEDDRPWSLWIDDDVSAPRGTLDWIEFVAQAIERFPKGEAIVYGAYPTRAMGRRTFACGFVAASIILGEGGGYHRAHWVGGGAALVHRSTWHRLAETLGIPGPGRCLYQGQRGERWWGPCVWRNEIHEHPGVDPLYPGAPILAEDGEDVGMSMAARRAAVPIYVDTRLRLDHEGRHPFRWEDVLSPVLPRQRSLNLEAPSASLSSLILELPSSSLPSEPHG